MRRTRKIINGASYKIGNDLFLTHAQDTLHRKDDGAVSPLVDNNTDLENYVDKDRPYINGAANLFDFYDPILQFGFRGCDWFHTSNSRAPCLRGCENDGELEEAPGPNR